VRRGIGWARDALDAAAAGAAGATEGGASGSGSSGGSGGGSGSSGGGSAIRQLVVAGGVASNQYIRQRLAAVAAAAGLELVVPPPRWCTDNGVMVAWAGIERCEARAARRRGWGLGPRGQAACWLA
jgi:hypothetical protein